MKKKILAVLLCALMTIVFAAGCAKTEQEQAASGEQAAAAGEQSAPEEQSSPEEKYIGSWVPTIVMYEGEEHDMKEYYAEEEISMSLLSGGKAELIDASGTEEATWELSDDGVTVIQGTGDVEADNSSKIEFVDKGDGKMIVYSDDEQEDYILFEKVGD